MLLVVASASPVDCDVVSDGVVAEVVELVLLVIPAVLLDVDTGDVEVVTVELVLVLGELAVVELEAWVDVPTVDELEAGIALVVVGAEMYKRYMLQYSKKCQERKTRDFTLIS